VNIFSMLFVRSFLRKLCHQVYTCRSASTSSEPSDEPSSGPSEPFSDEPLPAASSQSSLFVVVIGLVSLLIEWQLAVAEEIAALEHTGTWDLEHGHDYDETFAPIAHMTTVRALLAVASVRAWSISQLDVKNAFLNGESREEVYMQPPPGYSVPEAAGFSASAHDPALFVHTSSRGRTLLLLYVDDMIITGDDPQFIAFVKARLTEQFLMSDLGPLRYFLEIETEETPMELNLHLSATDGEPLDDPTRYRHIVGSLVYLGVTRPDISYSVHILSQFVSAPTQLHYSHLLRVLRYLRGTMSRRLFFPRSSSLQLQAYCDATWASDSFNRRSLSAYCVFLGGSLIAWKTKKQTAVSRSSTEAELRAMSLVTAEVTWSRWLLADFGVSVSIPTPLLTDSTGAISIARDPVKHELTKHIGIDAYYTRA
ncbi:hypothetical protein U9M48_003522, partial [Paspalum notatum var. saurae]